jgi:hypothetical protein
MAILSAVTNMYANGGLGETPPEQATQPNLPPYGGLPPQGRQPRQPGQPPRGGRGRGRLAAVIVACAVVAGGAFAVTEAVSGSSPNLTPAASTALSNGPTGQAAVLNGVLADATPTASTPATKAAAVHRLGRALVRLRLLGGIHGEFTFETKTGARTLAFERGTVLSVTGSDVTVRATDGTTWTWVLTSASIVRENGSRTSASNVADNQLVFVAGQVTGSTRDARLLVIRSAPKKQA